MRLAAPCGGTVEAARMTLEKRLSAISKRSDVTARAFGYAEVVDKAEAVPRVAETGATYGKGRNRKPGST